ncbi:MAG: hypothetical protein ACRDQ5_21155 [Sciscionella sp.]
MSNAGEQRSEVDRCDTAGERGGTRPLVGGAAGRFRCPSTSDSSWSEVIGRGGVSPEPSATSIRRRQRDDQERDPLGHQGTHRQFRAESNLAQGHRRVAPTAVEEIVRWAS